MDDSKSIRLRSGKTVAKRKSATNESKIGSIDEKSAAKKTKNNDLNSKNSNKAINGFCDPFVAKNRRKSEEINAYISSLVLWRRPLNTLYYATHELIHLLVRLTKWVLCHTRTCFSVILLLLILIIVSNIDGSHQKLISVLRKQCLWCMYWCGLGILSSVGLGTGLHTFLLYLGPHIASVTLAAYECDSLDFPSPPYPDEIVCPDSTPNPLSLGVNVWTIMSKVRLEAFMWGAGTALGELPPYFVARAHRLSGEDEEDIDPLLAQEITGASTNSTINGVQEVSIAKRFKAKMVRLVTKVGFFGILACASIPNPLFDLAGITCGYSLVPFWTFFGATLIGKAVVKMHIQKLFVIVAFNENYVELFVNSSRNIPYVGKYLHEPLREFLVKQKKSLHRGSAQVVKETSWLSIIFEWVVISMIVYFLVSIINSMAQNNQKRILKAKEENQQLIQNSNHIKSK